MEGFLTFIIFLILGFYVLGFIGKLALKYYLKRMQKRFTNGNAGHYQQYTYNFGGQKQSTEKHNEGDVFISQASEPKEKKFKKDVGDYVDFEEIK